MRPPGSQHWQQVSGTEPGNPFSLSPFPFSLAWWRPLCLGLLLPLLLSACLTTQGNRKAPALRGLSASEAERLETLHNPDWRQPLPRPSREETPENLAETAELMLQSGDYERSIYSYSKILHQDPQRHDIRYKLGLALLMTGRLGDAKRELAEVLVHKMDMPEAHDLSPSRLISPDSSTHAKRFPSYGA